MFNFYRCILVPFQMLAHFIKTYGLRYHINTNIGSYHEWHDEPYDLIDVPYKWDLSYGLQISHPRHLARAGEAPGIMANLVISDTSKA